MAINIQWRVTVDPRGLAGTSEVTEFSPDGSLIAAGNGVGEIRLLRASDGVEVDRIIFRVSPFDNKAGEIEAIAFSPDGQLLAASGNADGIKVYRLSDKSLVASFPGRDSDGIAFSPDGLYLATSTRGAVQLISTANWKIRYTIPAGESLNSIDFTRDSQFMVIAGSSGDGTIGALKIIRVATGETVQTITTSGGVKSVRLSPDGSLIASANARGDVVQVFRFSDGALIKELPQPGVYMEAVAWSGKYLLTGGGSDIGNGNPLRIYDSSLDFRLIKENQDNLANIEYIDVRGQNVITSSEDGTVIRYLLTNTPFGSPSPSPSPVPSPSPGPSPSPNPSPSPSGTVRYGLKGEYFNNKNFTDLAFTRTDATVNFNWGRRSPSARVGPDTFSVRWIGQVRPQFSELYTFYATADDGVRLWVNGRKIIDAFRDQGATTKAGKIRLQAGRRYDIRLEYYENRGTALSRLEWSSPSLEREIVPQVRLFRGASTTRTAIAPKSTVDTTAALDQEKIVVEAEDIDRLSGFWREADVSAASGREVIRLDGGDERRQNGATFDFTGAKGDYNIIVGYFDEDDGFASAALEVEGKKISSWRFDQKLGFSEPTHQTRTSHLISNVLLSPGDTIRLSGLENRGEPVRIDNITFVPV